MEKLDVSIAVGCNVGATSPVPIPPEMRKILSYNPKFNPHLGLNAIYKLNERWGIASGISIDWKGMRVKDKVKYMHTSVVVVEGNDRLTGYFVGENMTNTDNVYLTIPICGSYKINERWQVKLGVYAAKTLSAKFNGSVSNGYIRIGDPTGQKQEIDEAFFDFSKDVRDYDFGLSANGEYKIKSRLGVYANLSWGISPYFYSGSAPINFTMRNIYGTIGFTYHL